ncbi:uncharacterized protein LOC126714825 [Quercus robur]|uniref:uncharacterized protein LOC126714825 n=1 Tax=Quercus robur TaxID=38942 RepID=UPI002163D6AC|nr:uncharacterized protein LOC126714825 [Quercus robur]
MWSMWMIGVSVVVPHLIVSGRYGQATSVLLHLIGNVMGFASLLRESWMFTSAVARMRTLYGVQATERQGAVPPNSGRTYRLIIASKSSINSLFEEAIPLSSTLHALIFSIKL